ncbi:hypothetical protein HOA55_01410 [archaeon]|jgi:phosphate uptake regulator|nr:hypothetical protein [archaeon]MBT3578036.1 hypothetical protein [archaeon]MBT6819991.1 hypothetical protein [archaeon]MBT6956293.1 hypothetical protein [archaeon]MBT7025028.1 hypothetical protein [archaeon]
MKIIERNLQEIGKSLFVSLPKDWTRTLKLKKGSKIKMTMSDQGNLIISPEFLKKDSNKTSTIDFDENFGRNFFRDYFHGSGKITINIPTDIKEKSLKSIYSFLEKFMNTQIIEETASKIVVKSFKIEELSIEECLKRMQYISSDMIDEALGKNSKTKINELEKSLTKFYFILVMQIRRFLDEGKFTQENQISLTRALDFRMAGEKIERVSDIIKDFPDITNKEVSKILERTNELYQKSFASFVNKNYEKSLELSNKSELQDLQKLKNKALKSKDLALQSQVINLDRILDYVKEIYSLTR